MASRFSQRARGLAAAGFTVAGAGALVATAAAETKTTPGKSGSYMVDLSDGGMEIGYLDKAGAQFCEVYAKDGKTKLYAGPPTSASAPTAVAKADIPGSIATVHAAVAELQTAGAEQRSELIVRLLGVNTAAIADADKEGLRVMDTRLRPIRRGQKFAGPARTVSTCNDFLTVIKALEESERGEVLVIDTQNSTRTVIGELFGTESIRRGIAAIVLDGPCRDTAQLAQMDIPVFITGTRPISGTCCKIYETQVPVVAGGVVVQPGDIIFGDDDGIIVASEAQMMAALPGAEGVVAAEDALLHGMKSGTSLLDMLNFKEHYGEIAKGNSNSKLQFMSKGSGNGTEVA